jgi:RNA polymerase sigma-70 factor (ECF subfamily)
VAEFDEGAEAALLREGRAGDRAALERLISLHKRPLFALCFRMLGNADDADDAVQETFLRALRALPAFRADAAFRTWLYRIAVNVCLKCRAAHAPTVPLDEQRGHASCGAPGALWRGSDSDGVGASPELLALRQLRLQEALDVLPPRQRAVLLLKEREGWSMAEIGAAMGWNEKRVENELYRARRALVLWRRREAEEGDAQ